jgi:hypothetical protein
MIFYDYEHSTTLILGLPVGTIISDSMLSDINLILIKYNIILNVMNNVDDTTTINLMYGNKIKESDKIFVQKFATEIKKMNFSFEDTQILCILNNIIRTIKLNDLCIM